MGPLGNLIEHRGLELGGLTLEDRVPRFIVGRLQVDLKTTGKPGLNPLLQQALARRFVTGHHYLLARHVQLVESMEEAFLGLWLG